jgi:hypothetical protein
VALPPHDLRVAARTSSNCQALPNIQVVTIADQFQGGRRSIAMSQQPTQVTRGGAQTRQLLDTKELPIFRVRTAMLAMVRQIVDSQSDVPPLLPYMLLGGLGLQRLARFLDKSMTDCQFLRW